MPSRRKPSERNTFFVDSKADRSILLFVPHPRYRPVSQHIQLISHPIHCGHIIRTAVVITAIHICQITGISNFNTVFDFNIDDYLYSIFMNTLIQLL